VVLAPQLSQTVIAHHALRGQGSIDPVPIGRKMIARYAAPMSPVDLFGFLTLEANDEVAPHSREGDRAGHDDAAASRIDEGFKQGTML
jgi:hypothetical protein